MSRRALRWARVALLLGVNGAAFLFVAGPARADTDTETELTPEIRAYVKLTDTTRLYFRTELTRNLTQDTTDGLIGAHLDITIKPILRRQLREADWARDRYFWIRIGYQLSGSLNGEGWGSTENRGILEATGRAPLPYNVWLVNRMRIDLRYMETDFSARFRERLGIEREVVIAGVITEPYANAEVFYDTRYDAWCVQRYKGGVEIELSDHWSIEPNYTRQESQRSSPSHLNMVGLVLNAFW